MGMRTRADFSSGVIFPSYPQKDRLVEYDRINQVRLFEFQFEEFEQAGKQIRVPRIPIRMVRAYLIEINHIIAIKPN